MKQWSDEVRAMRILLRIRQVAPEPRQSLGGSLIWQRRRRMEVES
jgi:hypothetical protein